MKILPPLLLGLSLVCVPLAAPADKGGSKGPSDQAWERANDNASFKRGEDGYRDERPELWRHGDDGLDHSHGDGDDHYRDDRDRHRDGDHSATDRDMHERYRDRDRSSTGGDTRDRRQDGDDRDRTRDRDTDRRRDSGHDD